VVIGETLLGSALAKPALVYGVNPGLGRFAEDSGGLAVRVAEDFSARGIGRVAVDTGQCHRTGVRHTGMACAVDEQHRIVRGDGRERTVVRIAIAIGLRGDDPLLLMPAAADQPVAGRGALRGGGHQGDNLVPSTGRCEVHVHAQAAQCEKVAVPFDEAGEGGPAAEFNHPRPRADQRGDVGVRADRDDVASLGGERLDDAVVVVAGEHGPTAEDQIGRLGGAGDDSGSERQRRK
jgi:hypothetical protein